ncbi:coiled-coil domain-containing protein 148-like isoform X2 [Physella acuta]|nr:coiled-coil domain-containing protein 148-like isoform X2 [Physella acuta]XP_059177323.1 coiled-coil domain-containing protein 148-like isoform X2 [Physella acuta]XP_059177327.1 coiled-coil domain-containing protein 148-like isoform X2 [Physella acuta]XP_059177336.1 coiled-coil domain-containing protein 148-like isoform X2 [Physella acuta]XP_059177346.1 coiled-coil domain-containing protein 148-like isoform X2 [Physella acuta]XP_059177355.1 coiled-coil domain-containing protein 148-like iso
MDKYKPLPSMKTDYTDGLVLRMLDGLGSNKYKSVDYERLRASVTEKRFGSLKTLMKVNKMEQQSQQHRENTLLKQHHLVWQREFLRLQQCRRKVETELDAHMKTNRDSLVCGHIYKDFDYMEASLSADLDGFKKNTCEPVWNMREDLKYWLAEKREDLKYGAPEVIEQHAAIQSTVAHVKSQQEAILGKLATEQNCLETELQSESLMELCPPTHEKHCVVSPGIPQEALELECTDLLLKSNVLQEFTIIDDKYQSLIEELGHKHALATSCDSSGYWSPEEHFLFVAVHDQYPRELPNRRMLLFDRLRRHLPHKSRSNLSDHEDWWLDYKYYHERLKAVCSDWARDRRELLHKAQMVFSEAAIAQELEEVKCEYYHRQKQLCQVLYERVKEWREQKLEMLQLEAKLKEEQRREAQERELREQEAERKRRLKEKEVIGQYNMIKEKKRLEMEEATKRRLKELKELMEKQAAFDRDRIKFREEQISRKIDERKKKEEEKAQEAEEMEARLEALRAQVRVIADSDPLRTTQGTKAWESRLRPEEQEDVPMLEPLFKINSYTSKQITSDHRIRLEQRLREAGLLNTDYGRHVIRHATPPIQPRKDQLHTFKFSDS